MIGECYWSNDGTARGIEKVSSLATPEVLLPDRHAREYLHVDRSSLVLPDVAFCLWGNSDGGDGWQTSRTPLSRATEKIKHELNGKVSEEWLIKRDSDGKVQSLEPAIGRDPNPDPENLSNTRLTLFQQIDQSRLNEADKLKVFQAMQKLEQYVRDGKLGGHSEISRTEIASSYVHAGRLLSVNAPIDSVIDAFNLLSEKTLRWAGDCSGNFLSDKTKADDLNEKREPEVWNAKLTTGIATFTLNGMEIESWKLKYDGERLAFLEPALHADPRPDQERLNEARRLLVSGILKAELSSQARLEMFKDLAQIEHRARQGEMGKDLAGVRKELADSYKHLERLITNDSAAIRLDERLTIARQLTHQLADTTDIDQGMVSDACRVSVVECRLSVRRPSVVARVITDLALRGEVDFGSRKIKLDKESLQPASPFSTKIPRPENERSYASQLFQLAGMNLLGTEADVVREHIYFMNLNEKQPKISPYDRLVFRQQKEGPRAEKDENFPDGSTIRKGELLKKNNGMRVYGQKGDKLELIGTPAVLREGTNQPLLQACMTQRLLDLIDPGRHTGVVLAHRQVIYYTRDNFNEDGQRDSRGMVLFSTPEELESIIAKAADDGNFPLIIATRNMEADPGELPPRMEREESNHVITIRNYLRTRQAAAKEGLTAGRLVTDDQFGRSYDRRNSSILQLWQIVKPGP